MRNTTALALDPLADLTSPTRQRRRATPERFWARIDKDGPVMRADLGPCWIWTGRKARDGYGLLEWCGRGVGAHRLAYALAKGAIPAGVLVMHACDNPPCCNPDHLSPGDYLANNRDMVEKGRNASAQLVHVGTTNVNAKLTDDLVRELRASWRAGESLKSIAERTGLAVGTVHPMLHGRTWKHVLEVQAEGLAAMKAQEDGFDRLWADELGVEIGRASGGDR